MTCSPVRRPTRTQVAPLERHRIRPIRPTHREILEGLPEFAGF